jgi:hypothetical protein
MKRKVIFHGGCLDCLNQGVIKICRACQYKNADWSLPDLSKRHFEEKDIKEILDNIDIKDIERYLREKKLNKIKPE